MASRGKLRLPSTLADWKHVIHSALALPTSALAVPPHLLVLDAKQQPVWYDDWMPATKGPSVTAADVRPSSSAITKALDSRKSGVLVALMPLEPTVDTDVLWHDRRAKRIDRAGQPPPSVLVPQQDDKEKETTDASSSPHIEFEGMDLCFPLTLRQSHMRAHKGQMALPGGRCDPGENAELAAQREALEEIGLPPFAYEVVGRLTKTYSYPSKSFVTPVVGVCDEFAEGMRIASEDEVQSLHILRLSDLLLDPTGHHHRFEQKWSNGHTTMPAFFTHDGQRVWGLTGFIVTELVVRLSTALDTFFASSTSTDSTHNDISSGGHNARMFATTAALAKQSSGGGATDLMPWHNPYDPRQSVPTRKKGQDTRNTSPASKL